MAGCVQWRARAAAAMAPWSATAISASKSRGSSIHSQDMSVRHTPQGHPRQPDVKMLSAFKTARRVSGAPLLLATVAIARLGVPALSLAMLLAARDASGSYRTAAAISAA